MIKDKINRRMKDLGGVLAIIGLTILLTFSSCKKSWDKSTDPPPPPIEQMITQDFQLTNIYTMPMEKSFDPQTWVFQYNTDPFDLVFTNINNPSESVTKSVTIQQLQAGISVNIFSGVYNISYQTTHTSNTKVDIKIQMNNIQINGTPISLSATYQDYMLVADMQNIQSVVIWDNSTNNALYNLTNYNGFYYGYLNINDPNLVMRISFNGSPSKDVPLTGKVFGNIYWYTSPINAGTTIEFPAWVVNKIVI